MHSDELLDVAAAHFRNLGDKVIVTSEYVEVRRGVASVRMYPASPGRLRYVNRMGRYSSRLLTVFGWTFGLMLVTQIAIMISPVPKEVDARWLLGMPTLLILLLILEVLGVHHPRTVEAIQAQAELALAAARSDRVLAAASAAKLL